MHERDFGLAAVRLHAYEWGDGPGPLVCLPGQLASGLSFNGFAAGLADRYRVVALDPRGRGRSDKPSSGYGYQLQVADTLDVLDRMDVERAVLIGHSFGAVIALLVAAWHPQRVAKLVLIDGGTDVPDYIHAAVSQLVQRLETVYPSEEAYVGLLRGLPQYQPWCPELEAFFRASVEPVEGGVRARTARWAIEQEVRAYVDGPPAYERVQRAVRCPTLVVRAEGGFFGADDVVLPKADYQAMLDRISDVRGVEVPGANHYTVLLGRPEGTIRAVREFLAET